MNPLMLLHDKEKARMVTTNLRFTIGANQTLRTWQRIHLPMWLTLNSVLSFIIFGKRAFLISHTTLETRRKHLVLPLMGEPKQRYKHHLSIFPFKGVFPNFWGFSLPTPCHSSASRKLNHWSFNDVWLGGWASRASCCTGAHLHRLPYSPPQVPVSTSSSRAAMHGCALCSLHQSAWLRGPERAEILLHQFAKLYTRALHPLREGAFFYLAQRHSLS